jgi:hypothetical protein
VDRELGHPPSRISKITNSIANSPKISIDLKIETKKHAASYLSRVFQRIRAGRGDVEGRNVLQRLDARAEPVAATK